MDDSNIQTQFANLSATDWLGFFAFPLIVAYVAWSTTAFYRPNVIPVNSERVLIVGASSGVGRAIALKYAKRGAQVAVMGRRKQLLDKVRQECQAAGSPKALAVVGDFTDVDAVLNARKLAEKEFGGLDTLVVAAGAMAGKPLLTGAANTPREPDGSFASGKPTKANIQKAKDVATAAMNANYLGPLNTAVTFSLAIEHPKIRFSHVLPATIEGDFRKSAVDGPAAEESPKKALKVDSVAETCKRVVFYVHFPDKLLATGKEATVVDHSAPKSLKGLLKLLYRLPADWIEEKTTGYGDVLLANSRFTAQVFKRSFRSITRSPEVVYPGINLDAYDAPAPSLDTLESPLIGLGRKTLLSLNRFERKKNTALAIEAFAELKRRQKSASSETVRLVIGGGYDPRVRDNIDTLQHLISICNQHSLSYDILPNQTSPPPPRPTSLPSPESVDILFILNFTTAQRQYLLRSPTTICLLYTPGNEHFGIGPVEGMACGLPVVACTTGGPTESLVDISANQSEGVAWLRDPEPLLWANALQEVLALSSSDREALAVRAKKRARDLFSMEQMARGFEAALYRAMDMGVVGDSPIRIKNLRMAMALLVMILWLRMNGMDLLGGPAALILILMVAMMSLRRSP
ncbi:Alpha-1,3-mannosyltransferase-like protein [Tulasnella sp. 408]|nr:Alpha-1,3-mannosyltransferase-like protein [Tulasnella sp. 408]